MKKEVTQLLSEWNQSGDKEILDRIFPLVYAELRRIASARLKNERAGITVQPTELAHEAYLKLTPSENRSFESRLEFFGFVSKVMRSFLVDHARGKLAIKRGNGAKHESLEEVSIAIEGSEADILAIDEALSTLSKIDERKANIVELKFFGGLSTKEIANHLDISTSTVEREWAFSKAWLATNL